MIDNLILGLTAALQLKQFMFMVLGTVIGLWVGVLPGLGGPVAMAILIPFTFSMDPLSALLMLASISVGAAFGGSVTSILLNIPGEASSAATAYDGYPMAQQGKAKVAMGLSAGASMAAAIAGVLILMFASGPVAKAALAFSPAEYFALAILGLTVVSVAALGSTIKGLAMGALGIAISLIGIDSILGSERYTFGFVYLLDGISFVPGGRCDIRPPRRMRDGKGGQRAESESRGDAARDGDRDRKQDFTQGETHIHVLPLGRDRKARCHQKRGRGRGRARRHGGAGAAPDSRSRSATAAASTYS